MKNNVVRWNPVRELAAMQSAMDRMFEETWRDARNSVTNNLALDIHENDNAYTIVANVPGVKAEDINITLHDGVLTINAEIKKENRAEDTRTLLEERFFGSLTRRVNLPQAVQMDTVEASYDGGILTLTLPKSPDAQPRQIPVKVSALVDNQN